MNRSATMCIFFCMTFNNWTLDKAYNHVYACRSLIDPMDDNQMELIRHEKKLRGDKAEIPQRWGRSHAHKIKFL